jgi:hypothetical protein
VAEYKCIIYVQIFRLVWIKGKLGRKEEIEGKE